MVSKLCSSKSQDLVHGHSEQVLSLLGTHPQGGKQNPPLLKCGLDVHSDFFTKGQCGQRKTMMRSGEA